MGEGCACTDGRIYPWGDRLELERANVGADDPLRVGDHPAGASPWVCTTWLAMRSNGRQATRETASAAAAVAGSVFLFGRSADRVARKVEPTFANYVMLDFAAHVDR